MQNAEISGVEYQKGELAGYEVREYLLEKFGRKCAYCGATETRLEIDHVQARSRGGSDRVSNLALACHPCNQAKGNQDIRDFLSGKPDVLRQVLAKIKQPLADAAAVNATSSCLFEQLKATSPDWEKYEQQERGAPIRGGYRWRVQVPAREQTMLSVDYTVKTFVDSELIGGNRRD
jgi:hypothetical protein